ncbi:MAG: DUF4262 domain-containing protein [Streptosporangiaceae bacterium]|jgi:hypothetical protein
MSQQTAAREAGFAPRAAHLDNAGLAPLDELRRSIACSGWAVRRIGRGRFTPSRAYTAGLAGHDRPELIVTGLPLSRAARLLNELAADAIRAAPEPGARICVPGSAPIEIVDVTCPAAHLPAAAELYGRNIRAMQLVYADDLGHWPWDPGYRGFRGDQPILGNRAARSPAARSRLSWPGGRARGCQ